MQINAVLLWARRDGDIKMRPFLAVWLHQNLCLDVCDTSWSDFCQRGYRQTGYDMADLECETFTLQQ